MTKMSPGDLCVRPLSHCGGVRGLLRPVSLMLAAGMGVSAHADIRRWDNGEVIAGTEGLTPGPMIDLSGLMLSWANLRFRTMTGATFHSTNLTSATFESATLASANLSSATLDYANLRDIKGQSANFSSASLVSASLQSAELQAADFSNADLRHANLSFAWLDSADFSFSDLTNADLSYSTVPSSGVVIRMRDINLTGAMVTGANFNIYNNQMSGLTKEVLASTASYQSKQLSRIGLSALTLDGIDLSGQHLDSADLRYTSLIGADLTNADLTDAKLYSAKLMNANLAGATVARVDFSRTTSRGFTFLQLASTASYQERSLGNARFEDNEMIGWGFASQNLASASFLRANLASADFSGAALASAVFQSASLVSASLARADLAGASFRSSIATDADFTSTNLTSANLVSANLSGADFSHADLSFADMTNSSGFDDTAEGVVTRGTILPDGHVRPFTLLSTETWRIGGTGGDAVLMIEGLALEPGASVYLGNRPATLLQSLVIPAGSRLGEIGTLSVVSLILEPGSVLEGRGPITGEVFSQGTILPDRRLSIAGRFTSLGSIILDINPSSRGPIYDSLLINGNVELDGTVFVKFGSGFVPKLGQMFNLLDWTGAADFTGMTFDFSDSPLPQGLAWDMSAFGSSGVIAISAVPSSPSGVVLALGLVGVGRRRRRCRR